MCLRQILSYTCLVSPAQCRDGLVARRQVVCQRRGGASATNSAHDWRVWPCVASMWPSVSLGACLPSLSCRGGFSGLEITRKIEGPKKVVRVLEMHGTAWIGLPWLPEDPHPMPHLTRHWMLDAVPVAVSHIDKPLSPDIRASLSQHPAGFHQFDNHMATLNLTAGTSKHTRHIGKQFRQWPCLGR